MAFAFRKPWGDWKGGGIADENENTDYHNPGADGRRAQALLASPEGKPRQEIFNFADGGAALYFFEAKEV